MARPRVLVTGLRGFTGRHLQPVLESQGFEVHGVLAPHERPEPQAGLGKNEHVADLLDLAALERVATLVAPEYVVHLAAVSDVAHDDVEAIYRINIVGTRNLLQALASVSKPKSVVVASSANVYGQARVEPIDEGTPINPANDYAVSKAAMEHMAALWSDRLPITIVRPFNYTGRGQTPRFLVPKIMLAYQNRDAVLELGNTAVERDFTDVRDVVTAYAALLERAPGGTINICSGCVYSLCDVLGMAQLLTGHQPDIVVDPRLVRANEVPRLRGSNARLHALLPQWQPRPLLQTLQWMLSPVSQG